MHNTSFCNRKFKALMSMRNEDYEMKLDCCYAQVQRPLSNENGALSVSEPPGCFVLISFLYI